MHDSSFGRLIGVVVAPSKTFASIREKPTWAVPMVLLILISAVFAGVLFQKADMEQIIAEQMAAQGRNAPQQMTPEQQRMAERIGVGCGAAAVILMPPIILLIVAGIYMVFNLFGGELRYPVSLSVLGYSAVPSMITLLLSIPVILARASLTTEEVQSGRVLKSNLAFLAPEGASPVVSTLLSNLDLFALWGLVLSIIGYHVAAKVKKGTAAAVVIALWLVGVGIQVGLVSLRGLSGG
jgi:hypothetical protein